MKLEWTEQVGIGGFHAVVPYKSAGLPGIYEVVIERRPHYCDRGDWLIHVIPMGPGLTACSFDACDGFPRMFFGDGDAAKAQVETWADRRKDIQAAVNGGSPT